MTEDSVPVFDYFFFLHILFQIIQDILTGSQFLWRNLSQVYSDSDYQRRDQLNSVPRPMPELIQVVIELTGNPFSCSVQPLVPMSFKACNQQCTPGVNSKPFPGAIIQNSDPFRVRIQYLGTFG